MNSLLEQLWEYSQTDMYPFHMPGHKRLEIPDGQNGKFADGYGIDITEIDGFDNLHHPEGILKDAMDSAARIYGAEKSYFLVNGSTCGILSAVCGATSHGGKILVSRNCHKAAYHGMILNRLEAEYLYPEFLGGGHETSRIYGGVTPEMVKKALEADRRQQARPFRGDGETGRETCKEIGKETGIQAVLVVSPTYEGVVSDIEGIAQVCHEFGIPLIVDEAHGAHFPFGSFCDRMPVSAVQLGADLVIQSLHKTLPSFTQTAILHLNGSLVDRVKLERYLGMFQSSSPSYLFMAGIDRCIRYMNEEGRERMAQYEGRMARFYRNLERCRAFTVLGREIVGRSGVFDWDFSKIVIGTGKIPGLSGEALGEILRSRYHLEVEMCAQEYVIAMTSLMDTEDGLSRLEQAVLELDREYGMNGTSGTAAISGDGMAESEGSLSRFWPRAQVVMSLAEALDRKERRVSFAEALGAVSKEFVYLYPPGIPILAPGETITREAADMIQRYKELGLPVQGLSDHSISTILSVAEE